MKSIKIKRSKKEILSENDFKPQNIKMKVSLYLDLDVLQAAKARGPKYQSLINQILREKILNEPSVESRLEKLEKIIKEKLGA